MVEAVEKLWVVCMGKVVEESGHFSGIGRGWYWIGRVG